MFFFNGQETDIIYDIENKGKYLNTVFEISTLF